MGGSSPKPQESAPAASGFPSGPGTYQMQIPPEILQAMADQLHMGYGGNQRANLDQIYRPMTFPAFQPIGMQVSAPVAAPAQTGGLGASSWRAGIDPVGMPQS